jgi:hypothetical protein
MTDTKARTGYAPAGDLQMYYEVHGAGRPLVLLHGAYMAAGDFGPLLPGLAERHQVVVPEMQGHGRTADVDRRHHAPVRHAPPRRRPPARGGLRVVQQRRHPARGVGDVPLDRPGDVRRHADGADLQALVAPGLPASQLAILQGTTHFTPPGSGVLDRADWLLWMIRRFLDAE